MAVSEIQAKSILRRMRRLDSWFIAKAGMNLYRGCGHDCAYCDGRAEKYQVTGNFGGDIQVKVNAVELLVKELGLPPLDQPELLPVAAQQAGGFLLLGGGVGDSYQPAEMRFGMARKVLQLLAAHALPVHVLTKSDLVLRDIDLLKRIDDAAGALVSFSLSSVDDTLCSALEPGASPPSRRLGAIASLRRAGIHAGVFLMPVIPFLTDTTECIEESVRAAKNAGAEYVVFGGMTLKGGRQSDHFLSAIRRLGPDLAARIQRLYPGPATGQPDWGSAPPAYYTDIERRFASAARACRTPCRIPTELYDRTVTAEEKAMVRREHAAVARRMGLSVAAPEGPMRPAPGCSA
jgi:DNA repair photolyase